MILSFYKNKMWKSLPKSKTNSEKLAKFKNILKKVHFWHVFAKKFVKILLDNHAKKYKNLDRLKFR